MASIQLTRDQLNKFCQGDQDMIRKFELAFIGIEQLPSLEDGVDDNTLAISTLSDLVRPITIDPIQPLSAQVAANTTYTLTAGEATEGMKTILIPAAYLVASAGGPFKLTITTGTGTTSIVPISANGDTISSGSLMFDIHVDASGNVAPKYWSIHGSNSNGSYEKRSNFLMDQFGSWSAKSTTNVVGNWAGSTSGLANYADFTVTFPLSFSTVFGISATPYVDSNGMMRVSSATGPTVSSAGFQVFTGNGVVNTAGAWRAYGTWG